MKTEDFSKLTNSMQEKLGKENSSIIADDIGTLITDNTNMNKELEQKQQEIERLKTEKENLITVNGNLLQQVSMGEEPKKQMPSSEETKKFSFKSAFDEKGNFIE